MSQQSGCGPLPSPLPTDSARYRRAEATSFRSSSNGGTFGISCAKYRVGAPPPRPLPMRNVFDLARASLLAHFEREVKDRVHELLTLNGVTEYECDFRTRCIPEYPWTAEPTILIMAEWSLVSPNTWVQVVGDLKAWIDDRLHETGYDKEGATIAVEMIARELINWMIVRPVLNKPDLERDWPSIMNSVYGILELFDQTKSRMTSISLFRLGYSMYENPITVYISVDYNCLESTWPPVIEAIESYIQGTTHDLHVYMEHNIPQHWSFPLLTRSMNDQEATCRDNELPWSISRDYQEIVDMGAQIGACRYITRDDGKQCNPGFGTLGCYIEIKTKQNQQWAKFGLTTYHVVRSALQGYSFKSKILRPVDPLDQSPMSSCLTAEQMNAITISELEDPSRDSDLWRSDRDGLSPTARERRYPMESPSRLSHSYTVDNEQQFIANVPSVAQLCDKVRAQIGQKIAFFDDDRQLLGSIWAGSGWGRRTPKNNRLDWALIEVNENRIGRNLLPDFRIWMKHYDCDSKFLPRDAGMTGILKPQTELSSKCYLSGTIAHKVGASTIETSGYISPYQSRIRLKQDSYMDPTVSDEWVFMGRQAKGRLFAHNGDSGAVVFNSDREVLGLLFAGQKLQKTSQAGVTYFTPIEDVFKDIVESSEGQITDIRIAMS